MNPDAIAPGDVVRIAAGGRMFHGIVRGRVLGGLEVDPIERGVVARRVKARDIVEHWSRAGRRRGAEDSAQRSFDDLLDR
jgi:hypothetical protein